MLIMMRNHLLRYGPSLVLFAALSLPAPAAAQTVGAEGGLNLATLTSSAPGAPANQWLPGITAGGFVVLKALGITWQIEGLYSVKGAKVPPSPAVDLQITYFELPVAVRFSLWRWGSSTFHAFGGATFAATLDAKVKDAGFTTDIDESIEKSDVGVTGGVAYERGRLVASTRYTHGLRNVAVGGPLDEIVRNRSVTFLVGWKIK